MDEENWQILDCERVLYVSRGIDVILCDRSDGPQTLVVKMKKKNEERIVMPKPIAVVVNEGGVWVKFTVHKHVHAILFDNGQIFDTVNGWREFDEKYAAQIQEWIEEKYNGS